MTEHLLGWMASSWAVVLALSPALQARQMLRTNSSRDVSIPYLAIVFVGLTLWAAYGWAASNWYIALPNTLAVAVMAATLALAVHLRPSRHRSEEATGRIRRHDRGIT